MNKKTVIFVAMSLVFGNASAQTTPVCPDGTTVCAPQTQEMGDETNTNSVDNSQSEATQLNPSANTNNSGDITTDINNKAQASTHTGDVSASGGSANGNTSDNKSSANNSMGQSNTGNSTASTGASHSTSAGGSVGNTSAQGGSGGSGGSSLANGGAGGSITDSGNARLDDVGNASSVSNAQSGDSVSKGGTASVKTGGATGGSSAAQGGTSGGNVIDTRNQSTSVSNVSYRTQYIPSITQSAPIAVVPGSQLQKDQSSCGPRKVVVKTPAEVLVKGLWRARVRTVGYNYELQDAEQPWRIVRMPDGSTRAYGHEVVEWSAVRNVSVSSSIQLGGGGTGGDWGQAGVGGAGALQDIQTKPTLRDCEISYAPVIVEKIVPQYIEVSAPAAKPVARKRRPSRRVNKPLQDCIAECKALHRAGDIIRN